MCPVTDAVELLANAGGADERGAVFTRREVVDFVLDLSGYTVDKPLHRMRLLEPSFGDGDFLLPAVERLLQAWRNSGDVAAPIKALARCVRAVELHGDSVVRTRAALVVLMAQHGVDAKAATALADTWLIHADFLLVGLPDPFDIVVGNPLCVRQELIPAALLAEYRSRYATLYDRADLYIVGPAKCTLHLVLRRRPMRRDICDEGAALLPRVNGGELGGHGSR